MGAPMRLTRLRFELIVLYCAGMFAAMQLGLFGPMVPAMQAAFQAGKSDIALASSLITGAGAFTGIFAGAWIARAGYKRALIVGSIILIIGNLGAAFVPSLPLLYLFRFIAGFGYLIVVTGCPGMMCQLVSGRKLHLVMGIWGTFVPVGVALGAWTSGLMVEYFGWAAALQASMLPSFICLIGLLFLRPSYEQPKDNQTKQGNMAPVIRNSAAMHISMAFALFAGVTQAVALFLPSALIETGAWQVYEAATLMALGSVIGGCAGSILAGGLMARGLSGVTLFAGALILLALSSSAILSGPGFVLALVATGIFFFGQGVIGGAGFALLPAVAAQGLSMAVLQGMFTHINEIAVVSLPPLMGEIIDSRGWNAAILFTLITLGGSLIAILRFGSLISDKSKSYLEQKS